MNLKKRFLFFLVYSTIILIYINSTAGQGILVHPSNLHFEGKYDTQKIILLNTKDKSMNYSIKEPDGFIISNTTISIPAKERRIITLQLIAYSQAKRLQIIEEDEHIKKGLALPITYGKYTLLFPDLKKEIHNEQTQPEKKKGAAVMFSIPLIGLLCYCSYSFIAKGSLL
jgi:hypothetical protein